MNDVETIKRSAAECGNEPLEGHMGELKPCPFCKDEAERISNNGRFGVHGKCVDCMAFDIEPRGKKGTVADVETRKEGLG